MAGVIYYRNLRGCKYQLVERYQHETGLLSTKSVKSPLGWVSLTKTGLLTLKKGYAWDGPSGPTIDTPSFMRGSLVHDGLYQLIRLGLLPRARRKAADEILRDMCLEDGMPKVRAMYVYHAVRAFGARAARADKRNADKRRKAP